MLKIGIIVHSQTGNTLSVAEQLRERLRTAGHSACIEMVIPISDKLDKRHSTIELKTFPDISSYDALIFGAPVWGASLSPIFKTYLSRIPSLKDKKVACYVTEFFPFAWMGGNRAINQMKEISKSKGATIYGTGIVNWKNPSRQKRIAEMLEKFSSMF